jgi:hypothetical protein
VALRAGRDDGRLGDEDYERHADDPNEGPPDDLGAAGLWVTAILLVRRAGSRTRIAYNLCPWEADDTPEPPPRGRHGQWQRSTAGKAKGPGETLRERPNVTVRDGLERLPDP